MLLATFVIVISFIGIAFSGLSYGASSQRARNTRQVMKLEHSIKLIKERRLEGSPKEFFS